MIDSMINDGLTDAFNDIHMGVTAENLADQYGISRELRTSSPPTASRRPAKAIEKGVFKDEIVPIEVPDKKGTTLVETDEGPRGDTTAEGLGKLRAAFRKENGTVTAGNASGINDGAAAILVMSARRAVAARPGVVGHGRELRLGGRRAQGHGHRPGARRAQGARAGRPASSRTSTCSSSTRPSPPSRWP